jgi:hypothetical protein
MTGKGKKQAAPAQPAKKVLHPWSAEALLAKASRYSEEMMSHSTDDWRFGLLSTFVLEFISRAALAKISPALLADLKDWNNLYFALGEKPTASKFIPRSTDISTVFNRLQTAIPKFTTEQEGFAVQHFIRRNEELHTGIAAFDEAQATWLPSFYQMCEVLLESLGEDLKMLFGANQAAVAEEMIKASRDESAKAVMKAIAAHRTVWESKDETERTVATQQSIGWATKQFGHRVKCPACGNQSLIVGNPTAPSSRRLEGEMIIETQQYLPNKFECVACGLKIGGLSQLNAAGLGLPYKSTSTYDPIEYFASDPNAGYEDDNNEY